MRTRCDRNDRKKKYHQTRMQKRVRQNKRDEFKK